MQDTKTDPDAGVRLPAGWSRLLELGPPARRDEAHVDAEPPRHGHLGMFLDFGGDRDAIVTLEVAPVLLQRTADGEIAQVQAIDADAPPIDQLTADEAALLRTLFVLPHAPRKGRTYVRVAGPDADALLARMLNQTRCFLGGLAGLWLQRGASRPVDWRWQLAADGCQRLLPKLPEAQRTLRVGGLWYIDPEHARMGRLHDPLLDAGVLDLPPLEPLQAAVFACALPGSALAGTVPEPTLFGAPTRLDRAPAYCLTLCALARHARLVGGMPPLAYCSLAFDYAGVRVSGDDPDARVRRVQGKHLVEIQRHRAEELAALERLESVGLVPAVDCEGLPWELTEVLPEDAWLFPGTGYTGALEVNTPARWLAMRERLQAEGFQVDYAASFPFEVSPEAPRWYVRALAGRARHSYRLEVGVEIEGRRVDLLPAVATALAEEQFALQPTAGEPDDALWYAPLDERRRVPVPLRELRALLEPIGEYLGRPGQPVRLPWGQAGRLEELQAVLPPDGRVDAPATLKGLAARLREAAHQAESTTPAGFVGTLRQYQREGLRWLNALAEAGLGGVLADDMGLGKTVQLLAHVLALQEAGALPHPVLVVAPTSLLPNWESEIARYAPGLDYLTVHGAQRLARLESLAAHDLILTSYALLPRDLAEYRRHRYALLVLDEAQQVKNPRTQARRAARALRAERRVCLTGTPLENHLGELWSQLDLAVPGLLGSERSFRARYRVPIEKYGDAERQARLNRQTAPFILRRTKGQVARELPPKTQITRRVVLEGAQRRLYDRMRTDLYESLRETIAEQGVERSGIVVLEALLKLRQICCDPRLLKDEASEPPVPSAKFDALLDMLPELIAEGRRILLFSQFTEMLGLIGEELDARGLEYLRLTGQTRDRAAPVEAFQRGEAPLFLLSLKAGGVGLNLTAADTVIHFDPWWNPAAEAQASDRAHRIGQDKPVFVYRLICADTVEERIEALKVRKAELADAILAGGGSRDRLSFGEEDLEHLFAAP